MSLEFPKPDEIVGALTSFPPRLSILTKPFTAPEDFFEQQMKNVTGSEIPAGPVKMLLSLMSSFEVSIPAPTMRIPSLPGLPSPTPSPAPTTEVKSYFEIR